MGTISVEIDVDDIMEKVDTPFLIGVIKERGDSLDDTVGDAIERMWRAFYLGRDAEGNALARKIAESYTGRLVPVRTRPTVQQGHPVPLVARRPIPRTAT